MSTREKRPPPPAVREVEQQRAEVERERKEYVAEVFGDEATITGAYKALAGGDLAGTIVEARLKLFKGLLGEK